MKTDFTNEIKDLTDYLAGGRTTKQRSKLVDDLRASFRREMSGPERIAVAYKQATTDEERAEIKAIAEEQITLIPDPPANADPREWQARKDEVAAYVHAVGEYVSPEEEEDAAAAADYDENGNPLPVMNPPQPTTGPISEQLDALDRAWNSPGAMWSDPNSPTGKRQLTRGWYNQLQIGMMQRLEEAKAHDAALMEAYQAGDSEAYRNLTLESLPAHDPGNIIVCSDLNAVVADDAGLIDRMKNAGSAAELDALLDTQGGQVGLVRENS